MANKEAMVIVLDVGPTMGQSLPGCVPPLDSSLDCISMLIQRKIFIDPKDEVAMILFGTDGTDNELAKEAMKNGDDDQYQNIARLRGLTLADWDLIEELGGITSCNQHADIIDALVVAMDILMRESKGKKFSSFKIIVFSDLEGGVNDDQIDDITEGLKNFPTKVDVKLVCPFSIDDDVTSNDEAASSHDSNGGNNNNRFAKMKTPLQTEAAKILSQFLSDVDGAASTLSDVLPGMKYYSSNKPVVANPWKVNLSIGLEFEIPVAAYKKVSEIQRKTWDKTLAEDEDVRLKMDTTYHLNDEAQTEIEKDETITAYCYGSTLVPFLDEDKVNMAYVVESKCLSVLGFTKQTNIKRHHFVGNKVDFVVAQKDDDAAAVALSAFIHGLFETEMVAIARYAYGSRSSPRLVLLAPRIKSQFECLVSIQLPFMEDLRQFTFPPLDVNKKNVPSDTQLAIVDKLLDNMDLLAEREGVFDFHPYSVLNPYGQRYHQCLYSRSAHPNDPLPDIPEHLKKFIQPSSVVMKSCSDLLEQIQDSFKLEEIVTNSNIKTGASIFDTDDVESAAKRIKLDDDLDGGIANLIGNNSQPDKENTVEEEIPMNVEEKNDEPDEADDLLDMM